MDIHIYTATKVFEIPPFDTPFKLLFHVSDTIHSIAWQMLQPFAIFTLVVTIISVRREVDQKVELLVVDGHDAEYIQVVSTFNISF